MRSIPVLTPLGVGPGQPFPYISPLSLSLGVFVRDPDTGDERFARVKVPEGMPRFMKVGRRGLWIPLEHVIAHFLSALFPQMELAERAVFRVTRDADFEVSDEADDLLEAVELELRRRRFGDVVRLEVSSQMSAAMVERLKLGLDVDDSHVYQVGGLLDLSELAQLLRVERADLRDPAWLGATPPRFAAGIANDDLFAEIRRSDQLVHHPYESFATTFEAFVRAAAKDARRDRAEDDRVPNERRVAARARADRGVGRRQAERLPRRAEGSLRRATEHRVVAQARACRRARRVRLPEPEDPPQGDAGRAA